MAIIMESLVSLIKPLTWVAPMVPIIPVNLSGIIASPMGGLYGIHIDMWEKHCEDNLDEMANYAYVLFIREDAILCNEELEPIPYLNELEKAVKRIVELTNSTEIE